MIAGFSDLFHLPSVVATRWASPENPGAKVGGGGSANGGRKGSASYPLEPGQTIVLAEEVGKSGTIRRIWMTIEDRSPQMLRGIRLECYWDGAAKPAVSVPLGDFFGIGLGKMAVFESALFSNPEGRSFNTCVPMPFRSEMRITLTNDTSKKVAMLFYDVDYTIHDSHPDNMLYFHAFWRRERSTIMQRDYEVLPIIRGAGRFLGCNIGVMANTRVYEKSWWGEGEMKFFIDGDTTLPTLCGTGTEDYIGSAWGQGQYSHAYQGCPVADHEKMQFCFYRLHIPDPIYFRNDLRVTIFQIGWGNEEFKKQMRDKGTKIYRAGPGKVEADLAAPGNLNLFEREGEDWSSCTHLYLDKPESELQALPPLAERVAGLDEDANATKRMDV